MRNHNNGLFWCTHYRLSTPWRYDGSYIMCERDDDLVTFSRCANILSIFLPKIKTKTKKKKKLLSTSTRPITHSIIMAIFLRHCSRNRTIFMKSIFSPVISSRNASLYIGSLYGLLPNYILSFGRNWIFVNTTTFN